MALTILILVAASTGNVRAAQMHAPEAEVVQRLAPAFATGDPARIAMAFRAMGNYGLPASNVVESFINAMGYQRLANDEIEAAVAIFELNTETFPLSAKVWDSLAEAVMASGDKESAILHYRRSLDLDPGNSNALRMIARMEGEQQFSHATGS
jgi:tetratricopeptide (TPR) repeat protein